MASRLKHKIWHYKMPRREHRQNILYINRSNISLGQFPKAIEIKTKINKWDLIKLRSQTKTNITWYHLYIESKKRAQMK